MRWWFLRNDHERFVEDASWGRHWHQAPGARLGRDQGKKSRGSAGSSQPGHGSISTKPTTCYVFFN
ncbi:hypothetical protein ACFC4G_41935 [Streptomyces sp. NPDC056002]|uniref:hypothetical protein n=1 Tax=Streptomyces sp. NPDC056002 TaxID=3345675 RepID=UPI0035D7FA3D